MKQIKKWLQTYSLFCLFTIILLVIVEVLVRKGIVPNFIIPAPTGVVRTIFENWQPLLIRAFKCNDVGVFNWVCYYGHWWCGASC